jgi:hypothetical protein
MAWAEVATAKTKATAINLSIASSVVNQNTQNKRKRGEPR